MLLEACLFFSHINGGKRKSVPKHEMFIFSSRTNDRFLTLRERKDTIILYIFHFISEIESLYTYMCCMCE